MSDPYQILGVSRNATEKEIQTAYRKLAKQYHPDLNPGNKKAEDKFKEITAAQELLSNAEKRKRFDRGEINANGEEQRFSAGGYRNFAESAEGEHYNAFHGFGSENEAGDIFSRFFQQNRGKQERPVFKAKGRDVTYDLKVNFQDAVLGAIKRVTLPNQETLDVKIPEGLTEGQTLRLKGKGLEGIAGGERGDAYIECHILPHAYFSRRENDIYMTLPISITEAVFGGKIMVPTISGNVSMSIAAGSNTGSVLRLKGKGGIDAKTRQYGDQYVTLTIVLPETIDDELKEYIKRWSSHHSYNPRKHMEG